MFSAHELFATLEPNKGRMVELEESVIALRKTIKGLTNYASDLNDSLLKLHQEKVVLKNERDAAIESFVEYKQNSETPYKRTDGLINLQKDLLERLDDLSLATELLEDTFKYLPNAELNQFLQYTIDNNLDEKVSGCCGAKVYDDTDICSECKEHI